MIKILQPGDETVLERFLLPRLETSMFLISNLRQVGLVDRGRPYEGTYAATFEGGTMSGVVAHYWNQMLIFQAPDRANELWPVAVKASQRPIGGLLGPAEQVETVEAALGIDPENIQLDSTDKLYSLALADLIVPAALHSGELQARRIKADDLALMIDWRVAYAIETLGAEESAALHDESRSSIERTFEEGLLWLLEKGGQPVATTAFNAAIAEGVQVGGVWTPPALRGQGYGRAVVAASLLAAREQGGQTAILFTDEYNFPAQKAYTALGFREIGNYRLLLLKQPLTHREQ